MKDFISWSIEKTNLERTLQKAIVFKEREIWWCSIGINIGDEEDGKNQLFERPVLVVKKFNQRICWVLPMTSQAKEGPHYHQIHYQGKTFSLILSQLRLISTKRFRRRIRIINNQIFKEIKLKIKSFL